MFRLDGSITTQMFNGFRGGFYCKSRGWFVKF